MKSTTYPVEDCAAESTAGCIGKSLGNTYVVKQIVWLALLCTAIAVLRALIGHSTAWQSPVSHMLLEVCGVLITGGIVYCLWVQYCVSLERWVLLATVAFAGLAAGELVHAFTLAAVGIPQRLGFQYYFIWKTAAACLLTASACSTFIEDEQNRRRRVLRVIGTALVLSLCAAAVALRLVRSWPNIQNTVSYHLGWLPPFSLLAGIFCLAAMTAAFITFAGRHARCEDAFSDGITGYLLLAAAGQAAGLASPSDYSIFWWLSHLLLICGLSVLLIRLGAQFGDSYADAHEQIEHLEAVHYMSSCLSDTLDLKVVLRALVSEISGMLSARFASVMLADETGKCLTTIAKHGLPMEPLNPNRPKKLEGSGRPGFYSSHIARAFKERRICVVDDVHTDVEFIPWKLLARSSGYVVSVPLIHQDAPLGVVNLFFDKHVPLNNGRIQLFQTLASTGAVAIANARLYEKTLKGESGDTGRMRFRLAS